MTGPVLEVCFSPVLLKAVSDREKHNVVVVDILRATTAMCTAFGYGVQTIIPVDTEEKALEMKKKGWLVAGEQDGIKLSFADFGNSPLEFRNILTRGKDIVYCTTNGTRAIQLGKEHGKVADRFICEPGGSVWLAQTRREGCVDPLRRLEE